MTSGLSLEVVQLAQKFWAFFEHTTVLCRVVRSLLLVTILSHMSPVHILIIFTFYFNIQYIIIILINLCIFLNGSFQADFLTKTLYAFLFCPICAT
jgi:hypothetical protein